LDRGRPAPAGRAGRLVFRSQMILACAGTVRYGPAPTFVVGLDLQAGKQGPGQRGGDRRIRGPGRQRPSRGSVALSGTFSSRVWSPSFGGGAAVSAGSGG